MLRKEEKLNSRKVLQPKTRIVSNVRNNSIKHQLCQTGKLFIQTKPLQILQVSKMTDHRC